MRVALAWDSACRSATSFARPLIGFGAGFILMSFHRRDEICAGATRRSAIDWAELLSATAGRDRRLRGAGPRRPISEAARQPLSEIASALVEDSPMLDGGRRGIPLAAIPRGASIRFSPPQRPAPVSTEALISVGSGVRVPCRSGAEPYARAFQEPGADQDAFIRWASSDPKPRPEPTPGSTSRSRSRSVPITVSGGRKFSSRYTS